MAEYGILSGFFMPFYSKSFYRDVARHWGLKTYVFLFLFLAACWLPQMALPWWHFNRFLKKEAQTLVSQVPPITIKNGVATVDADLPHEIVFDEDGKEWTLAVLDTREDPIDIDTTDAIMVLTRDTLYTQQPNQPVQSQPLTNVKSFELNQKKLNKWMGLAKAWLFPALYLIAVPFSYAYRLIVVLIYGAIGLGIARNLGARLGYGQTLRLAIVAMVPMLVVDTLHSLLGSPIPRAIWWFVCVGAAIGFLFYGIKACVLRHQGLR